MIANEVEACDFYAAPVQKMDQLVLVVERFAQDRNNELGLLPLVILKIRIKLIPRKNQPIG